MRSARHKSQAGRGKWRAMAVAVPLVAALAGAGATALFEHEFAPTPHVCKPGELCDNMNSQVPAGATAEKGERAMLGDNLAGSGATEETSYSLAGVGLKMDATPAPRAVPAPVNTMKVTSAVVSGGHEPGKGYYAQVKVKTALGIPYWGAKVWFHMDGMSMAKKTGSNGVATVYLLPSPDQEQVQVTAFRGEDNGTPVLTATGATVLTVNITN